MTRIKFDLKFLLSYSEENNVELIGKYENVNRETRVRGLCKGEDCKNEFEKSFSCIIKKGGPYCNECTKIRKNEKFRQTNLERYGAENPMQNEEVKEKVIQTNLLNLGVKNPFQDESVKEKVRQTNLLNLGVPYPMQNEEVKEKVIQTNLLNLGVPYPMQNSEIFSKQQKTAFSIKPFIMPSGYIAQLQGYEHLAVRDLLKDFDEDQLLCYNDLDHDQQENFPIINYIDKEGKERTHYPDIFIPDKNLIIEVKSDYTYYLEEETNKMKQKFAIQQGYHYQFWIYFDKGGKVIEII